MVSKVNDIALLEAEISRLTLEKVLLESSVDRIKQGKFLLHSENFNGQDGDINFYTDFCSWDLFMLFFHAAAQLALQPLLDWIACVCSY